jgi:hypothetical protein
LSRDHCVISDRQTTKAWTALFVKTKRTKEDSLPPGSDEISIAKVRETFKEANGLITSASAGVSSLIKTLWNQQGSKSK